jgi:hypothetical protein
MERISIFLITTALIAGMVGCGSGSSANKIRTWYDLDDIRDNLGGNHLLMNNLDSTTAGYDELAGPTANQGKGWEPIGTFNLFNATEFIGTFDGQGYQISDLFIDRPDENYVGLFGVITGSGVIQDVSVVNAAVTGGEYVGGLVGLDRYGGTVSDSSTTGSVSGNWSVGGLVGLNMYGGTVSNSYYNYDEVLINEQNIITIGALLGEDFDQWLANDKFLNVNERLFQESGYYLINDVSDFKQLLAFGQDSSLKFRLENELDLSDEPNFYIPYLAGEFDGNGHNISNLSFNLDFISNVGLFGCLASGGEVTQVGVENINITGRSYVGGLLGDIWEGTVSDSYATGSVTGEGWSVGGLVGGISWGSVSDSYSTCSVTGNSGVGGLAGGGNRGTVNNSYSTGNVTGEEWDVGGLIGSNYDGIVSNSCSSGDVSGYNKVGGLMGSNEQGTVNNSNSTCSVTGNAYIGGLVGHSQGNVNDSFSTGSVSGNCSIGGLVGHLTWGSVSDSYSTCSVTGDHDVGGLVGDNYEGTVSNSYSTGNVTSEGWNVGGLIGFNDDGIVSNSFWDTETSGQATSDGGTGKTTTEMQDIDTFTDAGWDIIGVANLGIRNLSYIWNIVDDETYPFLSWQPIS